MAVSSCCFAWRAAFCTGVSLGSGIILLPGFRSGSPASSSSSNVKETAGLSLSSTVCRAEAARTRGRKEEKAAALPLPLAKATPSSCAADSANSPRHAATSGVRLRATKSSASAGNRAMAARAPGFCAVAVAAAGAVVLAGLACRESGMAAAANNITEVRIVIIRVWVGIDRGRQRAKSLAIARATP